MRRRAMWTIGAVAVLAACSSGASKVTTTPTSSSLPPAATSTNPSTSVPVTTAAPTSVTIPAVTTTTTTCPTATGSTAAKATPASQASALLLTVIADREVCTDRVVFSFSVHGGPGPGCHVGYTSGPFSEDASGKPVTVVGNAFVVVRCTPAYGYDFETGRTTYTGPKHVEPTGTEHVRQLAETGDFEGVVTWVVGLDARRPFGIAEQTIPPGLSTLTLTVS